MATLVRYIIGLSLIAISLMSCSNGASLQRYLVDKQEDDNFIKVDIATSLLESDDADFTEEQKEILETIKKVNVVAFPLKEKNKVAYEAEMLKVSKILENEQYVLLGKLSSDGSMMTMKYLGEEDAIDEVIIFASDDTRGFALFRLLGDNMKPGQMLKLMNSIDSGDLDVTALSGIGELFKDDKTDDSKEEMTEEVIVEAE